MARQEVVLQVFVASPGDVLAEREILESIIHELNRSWSRTLNLRLELIRWETDVVPGFGNYPQEVINKQIRNNYDVFIGIFWGRIGTETKKADSGTIEEFETAYSKFKDDPDSIEILIYFKDAPLSPSKIDSYQLSKLQDFKSRLGERGGLYWEFDTENDFESTLRSHLSALAQKWAQKLNTETSVLFTTEKKADLIVNEEENDDDYGFLDYLEAFETLNLDMCSALEHMSEATQNIGQNLEKRTAEMNEIGEVHDKATLSKAKKVLKLSSEDLERYA
ncbi:hypothetical protein, partial [Thiomicrorhabdus sp.]|uniref:hypothetical protein n=1 Tax=Thiomicrorhabdus sp. TaxID=2039724 RepID=UPI00356AEEC3